MPHDFVDPVLDITVVIPAHPARLRNGMLDRAVRSVGMQTSPPAALSIAVDLNREGAAATRQRALDAVETTWVAFLDSDDVFLERHLEWLSKHAVDTGADFVYSWFKILDAAGRIHEDDPVFPVTHYLNDWDPENPIETTITTLVRTDLAKQVGFKELDRGQMNTGEDAYFTIGCMNAGAHISHLKRKSWLWSHHNANTAGRPTHGDAVSG